MDDEKGIRLNKYIAECGVASRREADRLIEEGRVLIDKKKAVTGQRIFGCEIIEVNGKVIQGKNDKVVLAYNKPLGVTCTEKDRYAQKTISDSLNYPVRVTYAGRLDKESEGLILMTNDGELINALMRGANRHEKEYVVRVNKEITDSFIEKMAKGVYLKELDTVSRECIVIKKSKFTFNITLTQGLNRQIRRMCKALGYEVKSLKRIRVANILLANMKIGEYRKIEGIELQLLYDIAYHKM